MKIFFDFFLQTLHSSDSMVSLSYRTLIGFISDDNLTALQNFLENKRVQVDDRDEVRTFFFKQFFFLNLINFYLAIKSTHRMEAQRSFLQHLKVNYNLLENLLITEQMLMQKIR